MAVAVLKRTDFERGRDASKGASGSTATPPLVHRIAPDDTSLWKRYLSTWANSSMRTTYTHDPDLVRVVATAFPSLADKVSRMRTVVERTDIARLALLYAHGGVYADLDIELLSEAQLRAMRLTGKVYLPFEKGRLVGQSILISPSRHPLWAYLANRMVGEYDGSCYETLNTGPDKLTLLWNELCHSGHPLIADVVLHEGLIKGPVTRHHTTGKHTWKAKARKGTEERKLGLLGCAFVKANVTCRRAGAMVTTAVSAKSSAAKAKGGALKSSEKALKPKKAKKRSSSAPPKRGTCSVTRVALNPPPPSSVASAPPATGGGGLELVLARKRHSIALVAGTGLSAGAITTRQASLLQAATDVWALNHFFLHHDLTADFYQLELKTLSAKYARKQGCKRCANSSELSGKYPSSAIWDRLFVNATRARHSRTLFLSTTKHENDVVAALERASPCPSTLVTYPIAKEPSTSNMGGCTAELTARLKLGNLIQPADGGSSVSTRITEHCGASLTRVLHLIVRLRYAHVLFLGVDLTGTEHFYAALPGYRQEAALLPAFEVAATVFAKGMYGDAGLHATGARGVHRFIGRLADAMRGRIAFTNLAAASLLANVSGVRTVAPEQLLQRCSSLWQSVSSMLGFGGAEGCVRRALVDR